MELGFIGVGAMGQGMARSLMRAGHHVTIWNRTLARAEALAGEGAGVASTPAEAARAGIVFTMVSDDRALATVVSGPDGLLAGLPPAGVHVSMSTIGVESVERLAEHHEKAGQHLVSAPVFGRPDAAAAAKLFIVAAGRDHARARVLPLLNVMGQRVFELGAQPARANVVKLAGNFLITAAIEGLAEATAVVAKAGVERARFVEILLGTIFDAPVYRGYGELLLQQRFSPPGFALPLGIKDNRLLLEAAERLAVPLPLASLIRDRMLAALARGYGDQDWSVFARITAEEAGLADGRGEAQQGTT
jgi:3-hydroxyisobutyrate dehydrogenase-like beta-hydroxyacid dehydrogenase